MEKRTRKCPKKAKPGVFWVLEGESVGEDGCKRMQIVAENAITFSPGSVSPAGSVGAGRSPQATSAPRHAPQESLRAHLVAKSYRTLTKKSGTAEAIPDFFGRGRRT